jgi:4-diphosphocytidyl-2-C-methyl-D-erythritol kinase
LIPIDFSDILEIIPARKKGIDFHQTGLSLPGEKQDNLCWEACNIMLDKQVGGVEVHLHKLIPPGSGLGGGSSDATNTLVMMNSLFKKGLENVELMKIAETLGSDCPFFISNRAAAASGKGEIIQEITLDLQNYEILLVLPDIPISTNWAYSHIIPHKHEIPPSELALMDIKTWKEYMINDFESPVFKEYPILKDIRDQLYLKGALYSAMSGSGSSIYGIFNMIPAGIEDEFSGMKVIRTGILE